MGAGASITQEEASFYPQYELLGGESKFAELKDEKGKLSLEKVADPYLQYGGAYAGDIKDTIGFNYVKFSELPQFTSDHKTVVSSILTSDLFEKLKDVQSSNGYSLSNLIQLGVVTPSLEVGVSVGDEESWTLFSELLTPLVTQYHGVDVSTINQSFDLDASSIVISPEQQALFDEFIVSSKIQAYRNVSALAFSSGTTTNDRVTVEKLFKDSIVDPIFEFKGSYHDLTIVPEEGKKALKDKGYYFEAPRAGDALCGAGIGRSWPNNRGIFHTDDETVTVWVNHEDHYKITTTEIGSDIIAPFKKFSGFTESLLSSLTSKGYKFASHPNFGYLGPSPSKIGIAFFIRVVINAPKVKESGFLEKITSSFGLIFSALEDSKVEVSTKKILGVTEKSVIEVLIDGLDNILKLEKTLSGEATQENIQATVDAIVASAIDKYGAPVTVEKPAEPQVTTEVVKPPRPNPKSPNGENSTPVADAEKSGFVGYQSMKLGRLKIDVDELKIPGVTQE